MPTEQNNGLSKTEVETTSSSQLVGEQISRADQSVSHADGAEQHEASPKRRRTGRRVVRVAGAAGADVPVKIEIAKLLRRIMIRMLSILHMHGSPTRRLSTQRHSNLRMSRLRLVAITIVVSTLQQVQIRASELLNPAQ